MESRKEGRCSVYYEKKARFCRQEVSLKIPRELSDLNFKPLYCGNHYHLYSNHIQTNDQDHKRCKIVHGTNGTRIPCPVDPSHTIYEHKLIAHLKKCNKTRNENEVRTKSFYEHGINNGGYGAITEIEEHGKSQKEPTHCLDINKLARQILIAFRNTFTPNIMKPIETLSLEDIYTAIETHDLHKQELDLGLQQVPSEHQVKIGGRKHLVQIGSIIGHCRKLGLLDTSILLEMGAGRATTGFMVSSVCAKQKNVKLVLVERGGSRSKADTALRRKKDIEDDIFSKENRSKSYFNPENVELHRIKCDLGHVNVSTVLQDIGDDGLILCKEHSSDDASRDILLVAKHLCGAGTDLALKSVLPIRKRIRGCILATCCHGVCNWSDYVGRPFLTKVMTTHDTNLFGHEEFESEFSM